MRVSIIVAMYNVEMYIGRCIESLIQQEANDFEIVCINDASTDQTSMIAHKYENLNKMVRVLDNNENRGLSYTRNRGIKEASGEYLWFVDGDDYIQDRFAIEKLYKVANENTLDILAFSAHYEYENNELKEKYDQFARNKDYLRPPVVVTGKEFFVYHMNEDKFWSCVPFYIYRRTWMLENDIMFPPILFEDNYFMPLALYKADRVSWINAKYYVYYRRTNSITTRKNASAEKVESIMFVLDNLLGFWETTDYRKEEFLSQKKYINMLTSALVDEYMNVLKNNEKLRFRNIKHYHLFLMLMEQRYPLVSDHLDGQLIHTVLNYSSVIVYGAGFICKSVQNLLRDLHIGDYKIAVTNSTCIEIYSLKELVTEKDALVIIAAEGEKKIEMTDYATNLGFNNLLFVS